MKWRVILEQDPETNHWAACCPELPGCTSAGETEEEALENVQEAIQLDLQEAEPLGRHSQAEPGNEVKSLGTR
jgi:predicted RNase H-like HicB family nuclease